MGQDNRRVDASVAQWGEFLDEFVGSDWIHKIAGPHSGTFGLTRVLRIVFPGDMEVRESPMETIFASITSDLAEQIEPSVPKAQRREDSVPEARGRKDKDNFQRLINRLRRDVAQGWYFSRSFGHDAIIRDSIDYSEFIERFEIETRRSAKRIDAWQAFVDEYLDALKVATLTILLDDSDVQPELTHDILHSIRMFLNHPRIVTVIAGNIRSMRHSLLLQAMARLGPSTAVFAQTNVPDGQSNPTVNDWRQIERKAVEDYLEKVLPIDQRFYLKSPLQILPADPKAEPFGVITGITLSALCKEVLNLHRQPFLTDKFRLATRRSIRISDRPAEREHRRLENYLSWWVFSTRYQMTLAPRSARQIRTLGRYYRHITKDSPAQKEDEARSEAKFKRLIFAMFDNPENFTLIQRLGDQDTNVATWLQQQRLDSRWAGQRYFEINGRQVYRGS